MAPLMAFQNDRHGKSPKPKSGISVTQPLFIIDLRYSPFNTCFFDMGNLHNLVKIANSLKKASIFNMASNHCHNWLVLINIISSFDTTSTGKNASKTHNLLFGCMWEIVMLTMKIIISIIKTFDYLAPRGQFQNFCHRKWLNIGC